MSNELRILVEVGPKGKKVAAYAPEWPGFSRGGKSEHEAVEKLIAYLPRYAPVATLAGFGEEFGGIERAGTIETYPGTGSTDFWGISFASSEFDRVPMSDADLERDLALLQAAWTFFDQVAARVSAELKRGPRGGGRDRDRIIRHTLYAEYEMRKNVGIPVPDPPRFDDEELNTGRTAYLEAIRAHHREGKMARKTPLRHLIRHTAYHTLDHAWEMEDKNLSPV
jgi:hypothetical protein